MATHSSVLAWRIPGTGKPGGQHLWGRTESDTTGAMKQQQQQQQQQEVIADFRTGMHSERVNKVAPSSGQSSTFEFTNSLKFPVLIRLPNKAR